MTSFADLLMKVNRKSSSRRPMLVLKTDQYQEFMRRLKDSDLPLQFKAFMAVTISGGLRVTEGLSLRPSDFVLDGSGNRSEDTLEFKVLKKRDTGFYRKGEEEIEVDAHQVKRKIILHEIALELLKLWKEEKKKSFKSNKHFGNLFSYSRSEIDRLCKRYFGEGACHHSICRHSKISIFLFKDEMPPEKVANLMRIRLDNVSRYSHTDDVREYKAHYERMKKNG